MLTKDNFDQIFSPGAVLMEILGVTQNPPEEKKRIMDHYESLSAQKVVEGMMNVIEQKKIPIGPLLTNNLKTPEDWSVFLDQTDKIISDHITVEERMEISDAARLVSFLEILNVLIETGSKEDQEKIRNFLKSNSKFKEIYGYWEGSQTKTDI